MFESHEVEGRWIDDGQVPEAGTEVLSVLVGRIKVIAPLVCFLEVHLGKSKEESGRGNGLDSNRRGGMSSCIRRRYTLN